jgi:hypothetical protein
MVLAKKSESQTNNEASVQSMINMSRELMSL